MQLDILNIEGEKSGKTIELPSEIFGVEPNEHAVYLAVKQYLAHQRQGTHKTKERGEIVGSRRKIKKQKGTGTARAGDIKNPIFRGGGRIFGPKPRNYKVNLNKKVKNSARLSVLSDKAARGKIKVLEDFTFDEPKTKEFANILSSLEVKGRSLLLTNELDRTLTLSSRNIPNSEILDAKDINTYTLLKADTIILMESSIDVLKETFA